MKQHSLNEKKVQHGRECVSQTCNSAQLTAITCGLGPVLCIAGPGAGKTFVLTHRIRHLILEKHIDPSQILVITFSKAAALQMQQRFDRLMKDEYYPVRFGTFHAVFFQILSRYQGYTTKDILNNTRKKQILKTVFAQMDYQGKVDSDTMENILQQISYVKNLGGREVSSDKEFAEVYSNYDRILRQEHLLDFDDMLLLCRQLFLQRPDILEEYRSQIKYILVDEYQDINEVQYEVLKMLIQPHGNLFAVGDDDQSIYGFRGSNPDIMLRFKVDFPKSTIIPFVKNYRSTSEIVKCAGSVIGENTKRYEKDIIADKQGNGLFMHPFASKEEEYNELFNQLRRAHQIGMLEQCACLFRTNMDASYLSELMLKEKIPYTMKEKPYNPYEHFICQDFLHYLRLKEGDRFVWEFVPIMNRPLRYLSRDAVSVLDEQISFDALKRFYAGKDYMIQNVRKLEYDLERMKKMDLYAAVNYIRKGIGYDDYLRKLAREQNQPEDCYLKTADELQKRFAMFSCVEELEHHIEDYRECNVVRQSHRSTEGVALMTYHASKGLEFEKVYLPDCNEGIIPHKKSVLPSQIEEERRLFYVAMTRAKKELHIMFVEGNKEEKHLISRFLKNVYKEKY